MSALTSPEKAAQSSAEVHTEAHTVRQADKGERGGLGEGVDETGLQMAPKHLLTITVLIGYLICSKTPNLYSFVSAENDGNMTPHQPVVQLDEKFIL